MERTKKDLEEKIINYYNGDNDTMEDAPRVFFADMAIALVLKTVLDCMDDLQKQILDADKLTQEHLTTIRRDLTDAGNNRRELWNEIENNFKSFVELKRRVNVLEGNVPNKPKSHWRDAYNGKPNSEYSPLDDPAHVELAVLSVMTRGEAGLKPGSFLNALIESIVRADPKNIARLRNSFPVVVDAVKAYTTGEKIMEFPKIHEYVVLQRTETGGG